MSNNYWPVCWENAKEKHSSVSLCNFAVARKVTDKHTITLPKRAYIRIPSGVASPVVHKGWWDSEIREHNLINNSHQEDNKPDMVISPTGAGEKPVRRLSQGLPQSNLAFCLFCICWIDYFSTRCFPLLICHAFWPFSGRRVFPRM